MWNDAAAMENIMAFPQISYRIAIWLSISTSGNIAKRIKSETQPDICAFMFTAILFTIAQRGKEPECQWIELNKQNVASTYNVLLFSLIKDRNSDTYYNLDETWRHYAKWTKPVTKGQILYNSRKSYTILENCIENPIQF